MRTRAIAGSALSILALAAGCTLIYDAGDFEASSAVPEAGSIPDGATQVPDPCEHATPRSRPDATATGPKQKYVFALSHLALVAGNADHIGYDLDGVCTCDSRPGSSRGGASSCVPKRPDQPTCDNDGGRDNGAAALFARIFQNRADASVDVGFDLSVAEGVESLLVELDELEGVGDDPNVLVAIYDSPGLDPPAACDAGPAGDGGVSSSGRPKPGWTGCDAWQVSERSVIGAMPRTFTREAWVTGGKLVARIDPLRLRIGKSDLLVLDAILTATIDRSSALPRLTEGVVAGRVLAPDLIRTFSEQEIVPGFPICTSPDNVADFRERLCNSLDLTGARDAAAPCDSISFTVEFEAKLAQRGTVAPPSDAGTRCKDLGDLGKCP